MQLKSYTAPSMAEAMALVRQELGEDAIIVSIQRAAGNQGVRITAALERKGEDSILDNEIPGLSPSLHILEKSFRQHGVSDALSARLLSAARLVEGDDPIAACVIALEAEFAFSPLPLVSERPFILIGPPGTGKSSTIAKLATRTVLQKKKVGVVTADTVRAGAIEQLSVFTRILNVDLSTARSPEQLRQICEQKGREADIVYIDTPAINPFRSEDLDYLSELIEASGAEPVLVMAAGGDNLEAADIAEAFASIGASRLLATRLDMTWRLGAMLATANAGNLMFCDVGASPRIADGLSPLTPIMLARLLLSGRTEIEVPPKAPPHQPESEP